MDRLKCAAIIVAAGNGQRLNPDKPKQYMKLNNIPVLAHTIKVFQECSIVDEIILVTRPNDTAYCFEEIVQAYHFTKVVSVTGGGVTRQSSVFKGLEAALTNDSIVLIHDGARPFVSQEIIKNVYEGALKYGACVPGIPLSDTVKRVTDKMLIQSTVARHGLWAVQTPQGFSFNILSKAHNAALSDGFIGTDDAMLTERIGAPAYVIEGSAYNIKITTPDDLAFAEFIVSKGITKT